MTDRQRLSSESVALRLATKTHEEGLTLEVAHLVGRIFSLSFSGSISRGEGGWTAQMAFSGGARESVGLGDDIGAAKE